MEHPVALKLLASTAKSEVHTVSIDPTTAKGAFSAAGSGAPAVVVVRKAAAVGEAGAAIVDAADVLAVSQGDWSKALLIVVPGDGPIPAPALAHARGDEAFIADAQQRAGTPALANLAASTLAAIRAAGVDGNLEQVANETGRWVNRPTNTFTLKVQPRAGDIHFTLYGNPDTFEAGDFLRKDQNSYSRGWVRTEADIATLARLALVSHRRRNG